MLHITLIRGIKMVERRTVLQYYSIYISWKYYQSITWTLKRSQYNLCISTQRRMLITANI